MNVTDDQSQMIHDLFDGVLTPDQIEDFMVSLSATGTTADGLGKLFDGMAKISENEADASANLARKWELASADYVKRMQDIGRVPAGAASMAQQAETNFAAAREATALGDTAKATAKFAEGLGGMLAAFECAINAGEGLAHNNPTEFYGAFYKAGIALLAVGDAAAFIAAMGPVGLLADAAIYVGFAVAYQLVADYTWDHGVDDLFWGVAQDLGLKTTLLSAFNSAHDMYEQLSGSNAEAYVSTLSGIVISKGTDGSLSLDAQSGPLVDGDQDSILIGSVTDDYEAGGGGNDVLLGGSGNDELEGDAGDDTLRGMLDDDTLIGGAGNDRLEGGVGHDIYKFTSDDLGGGTVDVIYDEDGDGSIYFDGYPITDSDIGFRYLDKSSNGTWLTSDGTFSFSVIGDDDKTLVIQHRATGSKIVVQHWKNGDLGITIPGLDSTHGDQPLDLTSDNDVFGSNGQSGGSNNVDALSGNDALFGGAGDDSLEGGSGQDLVFGGTGNDHLSGGDDNDLLVDGSELMTFEDWSDEVDAGDGTTQRQRAQDEINQLGDAVLAEGKGWYVYKQSDPNDGPDRIVLVTSKGTDFLDPNSFPSGDDELVGGLGDDTLMAGEGDDIVSGDDGNDEIIGGADNDVIYGGEGNDSINGDTPSRWTSGVDLTAGTSNAANPNGNDVIDAGGGNDKVWGGGGNDIISGGDGDDQLAGYGDTAPIHVGISDNDYIDGGLGADTIYGDDGDDHLVGGEGNDELRGDNGLATTQFGNDLLEGGAGDDLLMGDGGDDALHGGDGADTLQGDADDLDGSFHGNDVLDGGSGNDQLFGGGGDDILDGGDGDDSLVGDTGSSQLNPNFDGNDSLFGGAGNDELFGDGGDDQLAGGDGNDSISGGDGNDQLLGGNDVDILDGGDGNDSLDGGTGDDQLTGGAGDDTLSGDVGVDQLRGGDGADKLDGGDGADTLLGEAGNDQIDGGTGTDQLFGNDGNDLLEGGDGDDLLDGGAGDDLLVGGSGSDTYVFEKNSGYDTIESSGDDGATDIVQLGAGITSSGTRYQVVGDDLNIIADGGGGLLVEDFFAPTTTIELHFDNGTVIGKDQLAASLNLPSPITGGANGGGVDGTDQNDRVYGGAGNDTLYGNLGDDFLSGLDGNDTLYGGPGNDTMEGGAGDDTYYVGGGMDVIMGLGDADSGSDTIILSGATSDSVSNFQITGDDLYLFLKNGDGVKMEGFLSGRNGTHVIQFGDGSRWTAADFSGPTWAGTSGDDTYVGTNANEILDGGAGNDVISGVGGNDKLYGGNGDDTLNGGDGADILYGGNGTDVLNGGAGGDLLYAGENEPDGTDVLAGGAGDDSYYAWAGLGIVELPGEGTDTLYSSSYDLTNIGWSHELPDNVENLVGVYVDANYDGDGVITRVLRGNDLDNTISLAPTTGLQSHAGHVYLLDGGAGADTLIGTIGDEIYVVDQPGDVIVESDSGPGQSFDIVRASYSYHLGQNSNIEEVQLWGTGDISAWGSDAADILDGSTSSGSNVLYGGNGNDHYVLGTGDTIVEDVGAGNDTVTLAMRGAAVSADTTFTLDDYANVENATLSDDLDVEGSWGPEPYGGNLLGNEQDNVLEGNGYANVIHGDAGNDTVSGGQHAPGTGLTEQHDELYGDAGADIVKAGRGGSDLHGGTGNDELDGGLGADNFHYDAGDGVDTVVSSPGTPLDQVVFGANVGTGDVAFSRDGTTLIVQVGTDAANQLRVDNYWADTSEGAALTGAIDQFVFADGTVRKGGLDHLPYTNNPPVAQVTSLQFDVTEGQAVSYQLPQDMFTDAPGDTLTLSLQGAPSWLILDSVSGLLTGTPPDGASDVQFKVVATDTWGQTADATLNMGVYNLIQGTGGDDVLTGTAGHDVIYGLAGNDVLDGAGGVDRLMGGSGDDEYHVHSSATTIVENPGEGQDTVIADVNYALGDNIERLVLAPGSTAVQAIGNSADNELVGNDLGNIMDGGQGADLMEGGAGDDTYYVDQAGDQVQESSGEGTDTVVSSVSWMLGDQVENLTLAGAADTDATGNALDNVLSGNDGANQLDGGAGNDTMYGGLGNDVYVTDSSGDQVVENPGEGIDTEERLFESNRTLADNVELLMLGDGVQTGNGNSLDNRIDGNAADNTLSGYAGADQLEGYDGADTLLGGAGDDMLVGDAGNDYLDGGAGVDQMAGGTGDDVYIVDATGDQVQENAGEGADQVQASVSYTLSDNVENLFLSGGQDIDGTGNALDNYLAGNAGDNTLQGMDGDDTLAASGGNDVLIGGAGNDAYLFNGTAGSTVIDNTGGGNDGIVFTNGINADQLSFGQDGDDLLVFLDGGATPLIRVTGHFLGGDASVDFLQTADGNVMNTNQINQAVSDDAGGGQFDQTVVGTSAAEQLVGSAGNDLIQGLAGDDQLFGLAGDDDLQGGAGDDYLSGGNGSGSGSGADLLEGGDGNDTLVGEDGDDTMIGGLGDDQYVYGGGQDVIDNSDGGSDGIFFNDGVTAANLAFSRDGDDLVITVGDDTASTVRVTNHFLGGDYAIDYVQPASGSMLDTAAIDALVDGGSSGGGGGDTSGETGNDADYANTVDGTSAGEQLLGTGGRDLIHGLGGDDTIFGFGGDDKFEGGDGNDYLSGGNGSFNGSGDDILIGGNGDDTLVGEDGDDMLIGGAGNDQYVWQTGSGSDTIDNTGGGTDWLFFNDIDRTRLGFHQDGDDLVIMVDDDSTQSVRVKSYFLGGDYAVSYIQPSDGYAIPASDINGMLTPMPSGSGMAAEAIAPAKISADESKVLPPVLDNAFDASSWGHGGLYGVRDFASFADFAYWKGGQEASLSMTATYWSHETYRPVGTAHPDPQVQRLIQAMSDFDGDRIADLDFSGHDEQHGFSLAVGRNMRSYEFGQHNNSAL